MLIQHNLAEDDCLDVQFIALRSAGEAPKAMIASAANRFIMMPDTRSHLLTFLEPSDVARLARVHSSFLPDVACVLYRSISLENLLRAEYRNNVRHCIHYHHWTGSTRLMSR